MMRSYSELIMLSTFEERFKYLKLQGAVGKETFGGSRYINQAFYMSEEWKRVRREVIIRDNGCDLGMPDRQILTKVYIHHINPISKDTLIHGDSSLLDLENLICCCFGTHQAIHYGDESLLPRELVVRRPGDTCPWR